MAPPTPNYRQRAGQQFNPKKEPKICRLCDKVYPNRAELILHLQRAWLREPTSHHHCHICALVFDNDGERSEHVQKVIAFSTYTSYSGKLTSIQFHALQAKLICPCCRCGPFLMPNHLMAHLKPESCPAYNGDAVTKFAVRSEFVHSLQTPQWSAASQASHTETPHAWAKEVKAATPRQGLTQWSQIQKARLMWKSSLDAWGKNAVKVYIDTDSQPVATARQAHTRQPPSKTGMGLHDPDHHNFNPETYMSQYSGRYTCPKDGCT